MKKLTISALFATALLCAQTPSVVVVSIDGLDHRYLKNRDALGLKIPNLRKLIHEGALADGVVGEVPTITWPSHTTMITGVPPALHGIQRNQVWDFSGIKVNTLWQDLQAAGRTTAAITWPVTVGAPITWNLPEVFDKRQGGSMDLAAIAKKSTPGLIAEITAKNPSFPQQWMDDRTRTLATRFLIKEKHPAFLALHLVDLDAEEHETKPFSPESKAILEYIDELLGQIMADLPRATTLVVISDHGFASVEKAVHPSAGKVTASILTAADAKAAAELDLLSRDPSSGIGRRIPSSEWSRFMPGIPEPAAAYEPADGFLFSTTDGKPKEPGVHGLWPGRPMYRSIYIAWGPSIKPASLPELQMTEIYQRLKALLKL